jgi:hypothetical protein
MDIRFRLRNVRSLYRVGSLITVLRELSKYNLDLVGVQKVRWEGGGTEPAGEYTLRGRAGGPQGGRTFLNQQLGMKVCTKLVMIMELG